MATLRQKISGLIKGSETCGLITVNRSGQPRCRLMANTATRVSDTFHLATALATNKVSEIKANPRVSLFYVSKDASYVCVIGRAKVTTDAKLKAKLWRREWAAHFPGGKTDPSYVVIKVVASRVEYFDNGTMQLDVLEP